MRKTWVWVLVFCWMASPAAAQPQGTAMKALYDEMKSHAEAERSYRAEKKGQIESVESQIDALRAEAKSKGESLDPAAVKPLQIQRLGLLEEVARRDVASAEKGLEFARRKLQMARDNLAAFEAKRAEAEKSLGA